MYNILVIDHAEKKQKLIGKIAYLDRAIQLCEDEVIKFVWTQEGEKYLAKPFHKKSRLPEGYSIVKKTNGFMGKYIVYCREPNGYFVSGQTKKIKTFMTVLTENSVLPLRFNEMDEHNRDLFNRVLEYLPEDYTMFLKPLSNNTSVPQNVTNATSP